MSPRVLILGGSGMLGHKLWQQFRPDLDTWTTLRARPRATLSRELYDDDRVVTGVDAFDLHSVRQVLDRVGPDVVINCIGIVKQSAAASDPIVSLTVNSLFPHHLERFCSDAGARLIHISTDCVFSGRGGMYTEDNVSDAEDLYGRSKLLGEVGSGNALTIRTSIIGRELSGTSGLVEWFLAQKGTVSGYTNAIFSGFTTVALAAILRSVICDNSSLGGVFHVAAEPITKYDLLNLLREAFNHRVEIAPDDRVRIDRSLDGSRFRRHTGFVPPRWDEMVSRMAGDPTPYVKWRASDDF